jgi:hypothetical protein
MQKSDFNEHFDKRHVELGFYGRHYSTLSTMNMPASDDQTGWAAGAGSARTVDHTGLPIRAPLLRSEDPRSTGEDGLTEGGEGVQHGAAVAAGTDESRLAQDGRVLAGRCR